MSQLIVPAADIEILGKYANTVGLNSDGYEFGHSNEIHEEIKVICRGI